MLRIASIGAGGRGRICKLAHRPDEGSRLVAVCDLRPEVLEDYRREIGEDLFTTDDHRRLLERDDIDAVFVTSPDFLHEQHAVDCLASGRSVYLEKPMAITIEGCDRIVAAAASAGPGVVLYVGHNMRFFPVMRKMKQLIDAGRIGEVQAVWCRHFINYGGDAYFKDWHSERRNTTGLLLQKGAHDIDVIHWLAGGHTRRVSAMGKLSVYDKVKDRRTGPPPAKADLFSGIWPPLTQTGLSPRIDVEDHSMVLMQLDNGVQASYTQCHYTPDSVRNYTVIGTEGRIENFGDHSTDHHHAHVAVWSHREADYAEHGQEWVRIPPTTGTHGGADPLVIDDFLRRLRGEPSRGGATPWDARMSVAAGVLATRSLREDNRAFDVPPQPVLEQVQAG